MNRLKMLVVMLGIASSAGAASLTLGTTQASAGGTVHLSVAFDTTGAQISALQFDLLYDKSALTITGTAGAAATAASKDIAPSSPPGVAGQRFLVFSVFNNSAIGSGNVVDFTIVVGASVPAGTLPLTFSNFSGSDPDGHTVNLTANSGSVTVGGATTTPHLTISKTHAGNFSQNQNNATYTITVGNNGSAPTTGTVTVTDTLPTGLAFISMSGSNWSCSSLTCSRSDALAVSGNYPSIIVTVNVAGNAASSVTNQATASGGGSTTASVSDITTINTVGGTPSLTVGSPSITAGSAGSSSIVLASQGAQVSAAQFVLTYDRNSLTITVSTGAAAQAAGKSVQASPTQTGQNVVIAGINNSAMGNGSIADLAISVGAGVAPGNYPITISGVSGSDPGGLSLAMTGVNGSVTVTTAGQCAFSINPSSTTVGSGSFTTGTSLTGSFTLTATGCTAANTWTAVSDSPRLLVTGPTSGNGATASTTINFSMYTNSTTAQRIAHINVAGRTFTVTQLGSNETQAQRVVRALYQTILGREPDSGGFDFWTGTGAPRDPVTGAVMFHAMADGFYRSPEFANSGWAVLSVTQAITGAFPDFNPWLNTVTQVRNGSLTLGQLANNLAGSASNSTFVTNVYQNAFGRPPNNTEFNTAVTNLNAGQPKIDFLNSTIISNSATEFINRTNPQLVKAFYYTILVRDTDAGGLQFWIDQLTNSPGQPGMYPIFNTPPAAYARKLAVIGQAVPPNPNLLGFLGSPEFQGLIQ